MLEMLCSIPENIGWVIVGVCGTLCFQMMVVLAKTIVLAIMERLDYEEESAYEE